MSIIARISSQAVKLDSLGMHLEHTYEDMQTTSPIFILFQYLKMRNKCYQEFVKNYQNGFEIAQLVYRYDMCLMPRDEWRECANRYVELDNFEERSYEYALAETEEVRKKAFEIMRNQNAYADSDLQEFVELLEEMIDEYKGVKS